MIELERIHIQHQQGNISYAVHSRRNSGENPGLRISRSGNEIIWDLVGLRQAEDQVVTGSPRATHIDFYIGLEDLIDQRIFFITSTGVSLGITTDGLRNPLSSVRPAGKAIRWVAPIGRTPINSVEAILRPFELTSNRTPIWLNTDGQTSPYAITSPISRRQTKKELHFGIAQDDLDIVETRSRNPRCQIKMSEDQYCSALEAIDFAITYYTTHIGRGQVV